MVAEEEDETPMMGVQVLVVEVGVMVEVGDGLQVEEAVVEGEEEVEQRFVIGMAQYTL